MSSTKSYHPRLGERVAEEAQLLAEEKWIIEALKKIKEQRNCLQIERLHLESQRAQLIKDVQQENRAARYGSLLSTVSSPTSTKKPAVVEEVNAVPMEILKNSNPTVGSTSEFLQEFNIEGELNNMEELNLAVTNPVFTPHDSCSYEMEEEDEDMDNCVIDMNMLMNGNDDV